MVVQALGVMGFKYICVSDGTMHTKSIQLSIVEGNV